MILEYSVLLVLFKLEDESLDVSGVDDKFAECRFDEDFIFYDRHGCWVELLMRHVEFLCWYCIGGRRKDLDPPS